MSFTIYQTNKKTGVVYAYLQTAYRDPITKKPKSKRTYLGRVDPVTKEIVQKETDGKRNRSKLGIDVNKDEEKPANDGMHNQEDIDLIQSQSLLIEKLTTENNRLRDTLSRIHNLSAAE